METCSAGKQYALGRSVGGLSRWGHDLPRNDRHGQCMSDMLKARSPKLSPDVTGKKLYRGPYIYSFTKEEEESIEHQESKGAGGGEWERI